MSMEAFQGKTQDELRDLLGYMKKELFNLRFQKATGELANTSRFRQVKRDIARVNTALGKLKQDAA
jgi:large subunit ribosomal protein L29